MIGGVILTALGAVAMAAGTGGYVDAVGGCTETNFSGTLVRSDCDNAASKLSAMTTLLAGAAGASIGVPLWIYGAEKVAATPDEAAPRPSASVTIGPASAMLHVSF